MAIDIDQELTVKLPASSVFAFDGVNADPSQVPFEVVAYSPKKAEAIETIKVTFNSEAAGEFDPYGMTAMKFKQGNSIASGISNWVVNGADLTVTLASVVSTPGEYTLVIPKGLITRASDGKEYAGELAFTITAPEAIKVSSVSPSGDIYSLKTIEVTFSKEVVDAETGAQVVLNNAEGAKVASASYSVEGKVLTVVLDEEVTAAGEYTLVIPEGVVEGAAIGDSFSGSVTLTIKEFDVYEPRNTGSKTRNDRNINAVSLTGSKSNSYSLTDEEKGLDYVNLVNTATPVEFVAVAGEELLPAVNAAGSWVHFAVYVDYDGDGFTSGIQAGSNYAPAGDLVAYSFYNNGSSSDESGWNSVGDVITGGNRNKPSIPAFTAPEAAGTYRMRFVQDWCSIDPQGDEDGKFGDFKQNGGAIVDLLLVVTAADGVENVEMDNVVKGIYDLTGRKLDQIVTPGAYIVNGKKVLVK